MTKRDVGRDDKAALLQDSEQTLRKKAEEIVQTRSTQILDMSEPWSPERTRQLLYELQVHQIELEMQNEELRRAQEELEASRARYFDLYDLAPVGYFTLNEEGMILEANLTMATLLEVERGTLVKQPFSHFILPQDQDIYYRHRKQLFETGAPQACEFRMLRTGALPFQAWLKSSVAEDVDGTPICRVVLADITERKQLEEVQAFLLHCGYPGSGESFFESLARYLARSLGMDYVCIDRLEGNGLTARTVAVYQDGIFEDNITYTLKDTPCGEAVGKAICCFPKDVRHLFPQDAALQQLMAESYVGTTLWSFDGKPIGLIAVIGRKPLLKTGLTESALKLVAVRAAGELERQRVEETLHQKSYDLNERIKELNCLYSFSKLIEQPGISSSEICEGLVNLIPAGWQYPEVTAARLLVGDQIFQTANFAATSWKQSSDILVDQKNAGCLQVCYLEGKPESDEGPFLKEERDLINELASRLGKTLQRMQAEREREQLVNELGCIVDIRTSDLVKANQELSNEIKERKIVQETLQESEKQLRLLSAQLLNIQEAERSRFSRELHDQLGQDLALIKLLIRSIDDKLPADPERAKGECESILSFVDQIIENVRRLSRDLSPAILEDLGLTAALRWLLNTYRANYSIQIQSELGDVDPLVPQEGHIMIYRVLQESMNNVIKHAAAQQVWVTAGVNDGSLSFVVADDGRGFNMNPADPSTSLELGLGLRILNERARILGGTLEIWSQPGKGTRVTLSLPVGKH